MRARVRLETECSVHAKFARTCALRFNRAFYASYWIRGAYVPRVDAPPIVRRTPVVGGSTRSPKIRFLFACLSIETAKIVFRPRLNEHLEVLIRERAQRVPFRPKLRRLKKKNREFFSCRSSTSVTLYSTYRVRESFVQLTRSTTLCIRMGHTRGLGYVTKIKIEIHLNNVKRIISLCRARRL